MGRNLSLRARLIGLQVIVFGGLLLGSPTVYFFLSRSLEKELDHHLIFLARELAKQYVETAEVAGAQSRPPFPCLSPNQVAGDTRAFGAAPPLPRHVLVLDSSGQVLCSDGELTPLAPQAAAVALRSFSLVFAEAEWPEETLRLVEWPFWGREGLKGVMEVGDSNFVIERTLRQGVALVGGVGFLAFLFLVGSSYLLAQKAFVPIDRIVRRVEQIDEANLAERLPPEGRSDEAGRLVQVINHMLGRLQCAFEAQKRFSSDVAHEIRSPLTALRGQIEVALRRERPAAEYQRVLEESLEEVLRLARLAENLMSLAQADAGVLQMLRVKVDLRELTAQAMRRLKPQAEEKNLRMVLDAAQPITVSGDRDWLGRLVENLLDNAIRHSSQVGEIQVQVAGSGSLATLTVQDSGPGIPPEHIPHIFDRFYRVDPSRSREGGGAGLGLAIAQQIALLHGGSIRVRSEVGRGSAFTVEIPLAPPAAATERTAPKPRMKRI